MFLVVINFMLIVLVRFIQEQKYFIILKYCQLSYRLTNQPVFCFGSAAVADGGQWMGCIRLLVWETLKLFAEILTV
jgi:hypothetical protein